MIGPSHDPDAAAGDGVPNAGGGPKRTFVGRFGGLVATGVGLRALGLVSQVLIAASFGAGRGLDAFFIALVAPVLVWGPATTTLELMMAPRHSEAMAASQAAARRFRDGLITAVAVVGLVVSIAMSFLAPVIVRIVAPGADDGVVELAAELARIINLGVGMRLVTAAVGAVLIAENRIFPVTAVRAVNSVTLIVAVVIGGSSPHALAWGTLAGDAIEMLILFVILGRVVGRPRLRRTGGVGLFSSEIVRFNLAQVAVLMVPAIDTAFISGLSVGTVTLYAISTRLFDAAKAVFLLPNARMAVQESNASPGPMRQLLRRTAWVGVLASGALVVGGPLLLLTVYTRGEFSSEDAHRAIPILLTLGIGLISASFTYVLPRLLVAAGQSKWVTRTSAVIIVSNIVLDAALVGPFGVVGVAAASIITVSGVGVLQYQVLRRTLHARVESETGGEI